MKQRHAARHATELAMKETIKLTMTRGPALAYAEDGTAFARAGPGGEAMAYNGSRAKLIAALHAQGMGSKQIDNALKDATK
jgi:hypothetical protein